MTTTSRHVLPPFALALDVYSALCAEGYDHETALRATWEYYEAIQAQRTAFVKGERG